MISYFLFIKVINTWVILYSLFPFWPFEIFTFFNDIFEIVKGKYSCTFVHDDTWYIVKSKVYFWGQSYFGLRWSYWNIFYDQKFILEPNIIRLFRHFEFIFLLVKGILINGFGKQKYWITQIHTIIASGIEICLSIC